jgi:hypothetical protein
MLNSCTIATGQGLLSPERGFISSQPAETWEHGLICGNGTIGANSLSRPLDETIIFSHSGLFMPMGNPVMPPDNSERLFEIRQLIDRGLYKQATQLAFDFSGQTDFLYPDPFVPAFDLRIQMNSDKKIHDYMRSVDFQTGETVVHWADDNGIFERRLFVSRADSVAVLLISGPKGSVNCSMQFMPRNPSDKLSTDKLASSYEMFKSHIGNIKIKANKNNLTYSNSYTKAYPGSIHELEGVASIRQKNGTLTQDGASLTITGADQVMIFIDIKLIYEAGGSRITEMENHLSGFPADYAGLLQRHTIIHKAIFDRVRLDLHGGADRKLTTEELMTKSTDSQLNKALIEKEFDAGRYNIISCTGKFPPTLQGIWAGTYDPDWASDFTHNGNVPSAIASELAGNMPELMLAYTSYIESIVPYLEINARNIFGARGVVLPSRSSTNGFNNALAPDFAGGFWVAGAPWAAHFFYDYYLYTGDKEFLARHALPFMEKVALFFEDYLYVGPDGKYIFSPTQSPENTPGNSNSQGTFNATMDVAATKELLNNLINGSEILGINGKKIEVWRAMLEKMPAYMISKDGNIKEWLTPKLENNDNHRHSSQLYPLFYGMPQEIAKDAALKAAFKSSIEYKLEKHWKNNRIGYMSFGLVQLGQAATSLGESELAYECLKYLVNRFWLNNLASMHNHRSLFNMDVSGGMPAVIISMLVGSQPGKIQLLPALPAAWASGGIQGILCRGQVEIKNLQWSENSLTVSMFSEKKQMITLNLPSPIKDISILKGKTSIQKSGEQNSRNIFLPAGSEITLDVQLK